MRKMPAPSGLPVDVSATYVMVIVENQTPPGE